VWAREGERAGEGDRNTYGGKGTKIDEEDIIERVDQVQSMKEPKSEDELDAAYEVSKILEELEGIKKRVHEIECMIRN
jgi:hypothetical protein